MLCPVCNDVDTEGKPYGSAHDHDVVDCWWCAKCGSGWLATPSGKILEVREAA
jgi:hypothetical protein